MFPYPAFSVGFLFFFPAKVKKLRSPKTVPFQPNIQMPHISCPFQHSFFLFFILQWTPRTSFPPHQKHWPGARCSHREHSACFSLYSTILKKSINEPGYFCFNILAFLFQFPLLLHSELISAAFLLFSVPCQWGLEVHPAQQNDALIWALAALQMLANNIEISF